MDDTRLLDGLIGLYVDFIEGNLNPVCKKVLHEKLS